MEVISDAVVFGPVEQDRACEVDPDGTLGRLDQNSIDSILVKASAGQMLLVKGRTWRPKRPLWPMTYYKCKGDVGSGL